jgi:predicted nucleic acid-binding protein
MAGVYFADTFYWIALIHRQDAWHARVAAWAGAHPAARFITTEEVLSEFLTWFAGSGPAGRTSVAGAVRKIVNDPAVQVLPQTTSDFHAALALYEARPDKDYSLTDCRSMVALRGLGLTEVLTNDHHFIQEGFTILFP